MAKARGVDIEALAAEIAGDPPKKTVEKPYDEAEMASVKPKSEEDRAAEAKKEVKRIADEYAELIAEAPAAERTRLILEMQEKIQNVEKPPAAHAIFAMSYAKTQLGAAEAQFVKPGQHARWVNHRPDIKSRRLFEGYVPIKDGEGQEVRAGDAILMAMPQRKFEETIQRPLRARKQYRREAVTSQFKATGEKLGVETFGEIKYDQPKGG